MYCHRSYRRDENHAEISDAMEKAGAFVVDLSPIGGGIPDTLVSYRGSLFFLEIKNPDGKRPAGRLGEFTDAQLEWLSRYGKSGGPPVRVAHSVDEALREIGACHGLDTPAPPRGTGVA